MNNSMNFDGEEFELDAYYSSPEYIGSPEYLETVEILRERLESIRNGEKLFTTEEVFAELKSRYGISFDSESETCERNTIDR